jgi:thymidylate synthase
MKSYLNILENILVNGKWKNNRTGIDTKSITGSMFEHDMSTGFPLLTSKFVSLKTVAVELEGFIKGITSKKWFQDRKCHIWDDWCNPQVVPYGNDEATKAKMKAEDDLGLIYGSQWRDFRDPDMHTKGDGIDQLKTIVNKLKTNPTDRRMICMAWNPLALDYQALPPCHYSWQVLSDGATLDLLWSQRSCDFGLGAPYNIASYALLLKLLAKEVGMKEGKLIGFLADTHIYRNQIEGVTEQLNRETHDLCSVDIPNFTSIYDWNYMDLEIKNYKHSGVLKLPLAV